MAKKKVPQRTDDKVREIILEFFYSIYRSARSLKSSRLKISNIKKELKTRGLTEKEITRNLDYLIQTEWILEEKESYQIRTGKRIITTATTTYKLSDKGINHFQGPSKFQRQHKITGINITNLQGVINIGDNNYIHAEFSKLYNELSILDEAMRRSEKFSDSEKLDLHADVEAIKTQLSKKHPNKKIIHEAWAAISKVASIGGFVSLVQKVVQLIKPFLGI